MEDAEILDSIKANIFEDIIAVDEAAITEMVDTSLDVSINASGAALAPVDDFIPDADIYAVSYTEAIALEYNGEESIAGLPTRQDLVDMDPESVKSINDLISKGKTLLFMPNDLEEVIEGGMSVLRLYGITSDGSKTVVTLTNLNISFDVAVPESKSVDAFSAHVLKILSNNDIYATASVINAYPIRGYTERPKPYIRVALSNIQIRKKAIDVIRDKGFETASDDRSSHYRKIAREMGLPLSSWAKLSDYEYLSDEETCSEFPLCRHIFRLKVSDYKPLVNPYDSKAKRDKSTAIIANKPKLAKDRTLVLTYDIETYTSRQTGDVPMAEYDTDCCFMICMTIHWKDDPKPLKSICLVDVPSAPDPRWITIVCGDETNVLKAFALCWRAFAPDIQTGFNDTFYDWPFVVKKAHKLGILGWMYHQMTAAPYRYIPKCESVLKYKYKTQSIKLGASQMPFESTYLKLPGCIPIDARVCYKKLFPASEFSSLKFFLQTNGLPAKVDLPIKRMWQYYVNSRGDPHNKVNAENMRHVSYYCVVDSSSCAELLVKRNVINDYREVSALAYVSTADSHFCAGGMKVRNLLGAYATRKNILISMIPVEVTEKGKYPGAYVFHPDKGICPNSVRLSAIEAAANKLREAELEALDVSSHDAVGMPTKATRIETLKQTLAEAFADFANDRPVTGLDFSSLYPSIIMTYNLSPEKIVFDEDIANGFLNKGVNIHKIEFTYLNRVVRAWSIRHDNITENIGLYPSVLIDLFNKRAEMKVELGAVSTTKEVLELISGLVDKSSKHTSATYDAIMTLKNKALETLARCSSTADIVIPAGSTHEEEVKDLKRLTKLAQEQLDEIERIFGGHLANANLDYKDALNAVLDNVAETEYKAKCFDYLRINAKQNALKVYMNTFYGETGNSLSAFFLLEIAGGVTSGGQYNIKKVADFVQSKGFKIKYGDSVSGHTAMVLRKDNIIFTQRIDEIVSPDEWQPYHEDKEAAVIPGLEVWSDTGFTPINRIIRHRYDKPLVRVLTHTGVVDCTTDHSLLRPNGEKVSPNDLSLGDELLHMNDDSDLISTTIEAITEDDAYWMGLSASEKIKPRVPACVLNSNRKIASAYLRGITGNSFDIIDAKFKTTTWHFNHTSHEMCTGIWLLGRKLGLEATINVIHDTANAVDDASFMLTFSSVKSSPTNQIINMRSVPAEEFVYDLETGSHHFHVGPGNLVVHNTDSLYLVAPSRYFADVDRDYAAGLTSREEWMAAMVRITMRALNQIRDEVNAYLKADNGTGYLKMAYEEVLYPVVFTGKKKYFGVPHLNEVNFKPKKLFIKGIEIIKQGQTGLAKTIGNRIMSACMSTANNRSLRQIVDDVLRDAVVNGRQWNFEDFVQMATYKPDKANVPVQRFIARMRAKHSLEKLEATRAMRAGESVKPYRYEIPDPGEKFKYVLVKTSATYDLKGRKINLRKGDRMEFASAAAALNLEIDVATYMINYVVGICARFINGDDEFQPPSVANYSDKQIDVFAQESAKKMLEKYVSRLSDIDPAMMRKRGYAYRRAYKAASTELRDLAADVSSGVAEVLHGDWLSYDMFNLNEEYSVDEAVGSVWQSADDFAKHVVDTESEQWCKGVIDTLGIRPENLFAETKTRRDVSIVERTIALTLTNIERETRAEITGLIPRLADIAARYGEGLTNFVAHKRYAEHIAHEDIGVDQSLVVTDTAIKPIECIDDSDIQALERLGELWDTALGLSVVKRQTLDFKRYVASLKNKAIGHIPTPSKVERRSLVRSAAAEYKPSGDIIDY